MNYNYNQGFDPTLNELANETKKQSNEIVHEYVTSGQVPPAIASRVFNDVGRHTPQFISELQKKHGNDRITVDILRNEVDRLVKHLMDKYKQNTQYQSMNNSWGQQPQMNNQMGNSWGQQPQMNYNQGGWGQQPQMNNNQGGWGQQPQMNNNQGGWGQQPQMNNNQGGWGQQPQMNNFDRGNNFNGGGNFGTWDMNKLRDNTSIYDTPKKPRPKTNNQNLFDDFNNKANNPQKNLFQSSNNIFPKVDSPKVVAQKKHINVTLEPIANSSNSIKNDILELKSIEFKGTDGNQYTGINSRIDKVCTDEEAKEIVGQFTDIDKENQMIVIRHDDSKVLHVPTTLFKKHHDKLIDILTDEDYDSKETFGGYYLIQKMVEGFPKQMKAPYEKLLIDNFNNHLFASGLCRDETYNLSVECLDDIKVLLDNTNKTVSKCKYRDPLYDKKLKDIVEEALTTFIIGLRICDSSNISGMSEKINQVRNYITNDGKHSVGDYFKELSTNNSKNNQVLNNIKSKLRNVTVLKYDKVLIVANNLPHNLNMENRIPNIIDADQELPPSVLNRVLDSTFNIEDISSLVVMEYRQFFKDGSTPKEYKMFTYLNQWVNKYIITVL